MSVIASTSLDNDEDLFLSNKLWDEVRKKGFEGVGEKSDNSESELSELSEDESGSDDEEGEEEFSDAESIDSE